MALPCSARWGSSVVVIVEMTAIVLRHSLVTRAVPRGSKVCRYCGVVRAYMHIANMWPDLKSEIVHV